MPSSLSPKLVFICVYLFLCPVSYSHHLFSIIATFSLKIQLYISSHVSANTNTNENAELKIVAEKTVWLLFVQFIFDSDTFHTHIRKLNIHYLFTFCSLPSSSIHFRALSLVFCSFSHFWAILLIKNAIGLPKKYELVYVCILCADNAHKPSCDSLQKYHLYFIPYFAFVS